MSDQVILLIDCYELKFWIRFRSPSKSRKSKAFKFSTKKDKREKSREKENKDTEKDKKKDKDKQKVKIKDKKKVKNSEPSLDISGKHVRFICHHMSVCVIFHVAVNYFSFHFTQKSYQYSAFHSA